MQLVDACDGGQIQASKTLQQASEEARRRTLAFRNAFEPSTKAVERALRKAESGSANVPKQFQLASKKLEDHIRQFAKVYGLLQKDESEIEQFATFTRAAMSKSNCKSASKPTAVPSELSPISHEDQKFGQDLGQ